MGKHYLEMTSSERILDRIVKNRAIEERVGQRIAKTKTSHKGPRVSFPRNGTTTGFSHADVFPPIASVMESLCKANNSYVTHRQIVAAVCADSALTHLLGDIASNDSAGRSREWWADSMVKWFSQTITMDRNPYSEMFERDDTCSPYRYRLRK